MRFPKLPYLLLALAVLIGDQVTKWLVELRLAGGPPREIIPGLLNFTHVNNTGVAFGLFPAHGNLGATVLLTVLGLGALTIVAVYFRRTPASDRLLLTALGLILGGAVGNLVDRVLHVLGEHLGVEELPQTVGLVLVGEAAGGVVWGPSHSAKCGSSVAEVLQAQKSPKASPIAPVSFP